MNLRASAAAQLAPMHPPPIVDLPTDTEQLLRISIVILILRVPSLAICLRGVVIVAQLRLKVEYVWVRRNGPCLQTSGSSCTMCRLNDSLL